MPLDEIARRYADRLFQKSFEESLERQKADLERILAEHLGRNLGVMTGGYIAAYAGVLLDHINLLGEARADSLLKAYDRAGLAFDDTALSEIKSEVMQFCHQKQHNAVSAIGQTIKQTFGGSNQRILKGPP